MKSKLVLGTPALSAATLIASCFGHARVYAEVDAPVVFVDEPTRWHRSRAYDRG